MAYKILVIDDDQQVCDFLAELLKMRGFDVHTACDGPEGLAKAKAVRPQVVLLDYMLPGMSGIQVLQGIKKTDREIGVIMVTGMTIPDLAMETFKLGAYDYITKPIDLEYFNTVVMEMISDLLPSSP